MRNLVLALSAICAISFITPAAASSFAVPDGSMTVVAGFPWNAPHTNYNYLLTNGTETYSGVNDGDGSFNGSHAAPLTSWLSAHEVKITGTIDLSSALDQTYIQFGVITKDQADRAFDWYNSGMFNNSAFATFATHGASVGDTAGGQQNALGAGQNGSLDFVVRLDLVNKMSYLAVTKNSITYNSSHALGDDNWGWDPEDFSKYGVVIQAYTERGDTSASTFRYSNVNIEAVPEPGTLLALGAGLAALARRRNRRS